MRTQKEIFKILGNLSCAQLCTLQTKGSEIFSKRVNFTASVYDNTCRTILFRGGEIYEEPT